MYSSEGQVVSGSRRHSISLPAFWGRYRVSLCLRWEDYKSISIQRKGRIGKGDTPPPEHERLGFLFLLYSSVASAGTGDPYFPGCLKFIFSSLILRLFSPFHHIHPAVQVEVKGSPSHSSQRMDFRASFSGLLHILDFPVSLKLTSWQQQKLFSPLPHIPWAHITQKHCWSLLALKGDSIYISSIWEQIPGTHPSAGPETFLLTVRRNSYALT